MGTSTITDVITDVTGAVVATSSGVAINIRLVSAGGQVGGFRISDGTEVASQTQISATTAGSFSVALENNTNITPTGTFYTVEAINPSSYGGTREWSILSSSSVSPQKLHDALISAIPSYSPPTTVPPTILSGNNTFTGTNLFNGDVYFGSGVPQFDLEAFGAVGNGSTASSTADTAALNTVLTQIQASAAGGGIINGRPGARYVFDDVIWPTTTHIWLKGGGATVVRSTEPGVTSSLHIGTGKQFTGSGLDATNSWTHVRATDWDFDSAGFGTDCWYMRAAYNSLWERVTIQNFTAGHGVLVDGQNSQKNTVRDSLIHNCLHGAKALGHSSSSSDQWTDFTVQDTMLHLNSASGATGELGSTLNLVRNYGNHASDANVYDLRGVTNFNIDGGHFEMSGSTGLAWSVVLELSTQAATQTNGGKISGIELVRSNQTTGTAMCLNLLSCKGVQVEGFFFSNAVALSSIGPVSVGAASEVCFGEGFWQGSTVPLAVVNSAATGVTASWIDVIPYPFTATIGAGSSGFMNIAGTSIATHPCPRNSWVVGVGYAAPGAIGAGTITYYPRGDAVSTYSLTATSTTPNYASQMRPPPIGGSTTERCSANSFFGLDYVTSGGFAGPATVYGTLWMAQNNHKTNPMF